MIGNAVATVTLSAEDSLLAAGLRRAANEVRSFAAGVGQNMSRLSLGPGPKKGQNWLGLKAGQAAGTLMSRGLDVLIDQGKEVFEFEEGLTRFGIATRKAGSELRDIGNEARRTSSEIGIGAGKVLYAAKAYSDLAGAENFSINKMNVLSRAAQASGADTQDLAGMMYQLTRSMKVTDAQMEDTIGGLINQAKDGGIEAKDMAKEFAAVLPLFARFKGATGREGALRVGSMFQVMRDNFNSAGEAGTALVRVLAGFRTYASRFEKHGVRIWDVDKNGVKTARNFYDIFDDLAKSDLVKDPEKLKKAFGRTEGWRGMEMLLEQVPRLRKLEESGRRNGVIMEDLATITESTSGRMAISFERMKNNFAEALTPDRVDTIVSGFEAAAAATAFLVDQGKTFGESTRATRQFFTGTPYKEAPQLESNSLMGVKTGAMTMGQLPELLKQIPQRQAAQIENTTRDELMLLENALGPSDKSFRRAIGYLKQDVPENELPQHRMYREAQASAGRWYLEHRGSDISDQRYKRLEADVQAAKAKVAEQNAKPPWLAEFAQMLATLLNQKPTVVAVDGNNIAKADANATDKRRGSK